jgi:menaquinone-dependent protoporphyrinogen IX oxidase
MNRCVVVYESKYGTTKKYAEWIAEDLSADLFERKAASADALTGYDVIVYGGGLYAGGVSGFSFIKNNFNTIKDKRVLLFTCGLGDPEVPENIDNIREGLDKFMTPEMKNKVEVFFLRGGMDYSKLNFVHKSLMSMVQKTVARKDQANRTPEEIAMIETYGKVVDFTDRSTIKPLVDRALL